MSPEAFILLTLTIAAALFFGRFLFAVLSVVFAGFLILVGLEIVSDIFTGTSTLSQLAAQLAPAVAVWFTALVAWARQKTGKS